MHVHAIKDASRLISDVHDKPHCNMSIRGRRHVIAGARSLEGAPHGYGTEATSSKGESLLRALDRERGCVEAHVPYEHCACAEWAELADECV
jgi:hypothetical protein